jgi:hypothetical protein
MHAQSQDCETNNAGRQAADVDRHFLSAAPKKNCPADENMRDGFKRANSQASHQDEDDGDDDQEFVFDYRVVVL